MSWKPLIAVPVVLVMIIGSVSLIPMASANHQEDYEDHPDLGYYENYIVYQTLAGQYQIMKSYLEMEYPVIQSDNARLIVDSQVYLGDLEEWSVGAGTMLRATKSIDINGDPYYAEIKNYFVYYSECLQCGSDYIQWGKYPQNKQQTQPRVEVHTENPTTNVCFTLNPDDLDSTTTDQYLCMIPDDNESTNEIGGVAIAGVAVNKSFTGNCEACRNSMSAEFYNMQTSTFRFPERPITWDGWYDDGRIMKCFYSDGYMHDFDSTQNSITVDIKGEKAVQGYMCDPNSNFYIESQGPKGWKWNNIKGSLK